MATTTKLVEDKQQWEDFLASHQEANFLQSWLWGEFYERLGKKVYRSGFYDGDTLVGVMLSIVEPAKRGRYLTVPAGPIIDWQKGEVWKMAVQEMKRIGKVEKCVFVRVRPQILQTDENARLFRAQGFKNAQMHLHAELTSQLDITQSEEDLKRNLRKGTRYELNQVPKRGIKVTSTTDPEAIDGFYDLQLVTAQRHGFVPYSKNYLKEQFTVFAGAGKALLYSAYTTDDKLIAQAYVIFYNQEAAYHYGASTDLGRSEPGAYAAQWEAILEAKKRGMTRYNFWGVVKPDQTGHRFYGVTVFKRGFRGEDVEYLHAQDLVLNKALYFPNWVIETVRKHRRHL